MEDQRRVCAVLAATATAVQRASADPVSQRPGPWSFNSISRVGFDWERGDFRRGHSLHNDKVRRAPLTGQIQAGRGGRLSG
jgi:hypothetical protein